MCEPAGKVFSLTVRLDDELAADSPLYRQDRAGVARSIARWLNESWAAKRDERPQVIYDWGRAKVEGERYAGVYEVLGGPLPWTRWEKPVGHEAVVSFYERALRESRRYADVRNLKFSARRALSVHARQRDKARAEQDRRRSCSALSDQSFLG